VLSIWQRCTVRQKLNFSFVSHSLVLLFQRAEQEHGDDQDVNRVVCQLLNRSVASRTITKQEAMCLLGGLSLVMCSDTIETVSLSGEVKLRVQGEIHSDTFLSTYCNRRECQEMSLDQYYYHKKQQTNTGDATTKFIAHYVGGASVPRYPVTPGYARSVLLVHKPWSNLNTIPTDDSYVALFNEFIVSPQCPLSVKVSFERAKLREQDRRRGREETTAEDTENSAPTENLHDTELDDAIALTSALADTMDIFDYIGGQEMDLGIHYHWSHRWFQVSYTTTNHWKTNQRKLD